MRKVLKKYLPSNEKIASNKSLNSLTKFFNDSRLWSLNRRSVAAALALGLFTAMLPIPMQMLVAAFLAIVFHANLPIAVLSVWVTNPLTMPVIFYANYKFGAWILNMQYKAEPHKNFLHWVKCNTQEILPPLLLGCVIVGIILAIVSYVLVRLIWRWSIHRRWRERKQRILEKIKQNSAKLELENIKLHMHKKGKDSENQLNKTSDKDDFKSE